MDESGAPFDGEKDKCFKRFKNFYQIGYSETIESVCTRERYYAYSNEIEPRHTYSSLVMISDYRMSFPMLGVDRHAKVRLGFTNIDPESNLSLSR